MGGGPLDLLNVLPLAPVLAAFPAGQGFLSQAAPLINAAQSALPPSVEDERRFAELIARWATIEGNFGDATLSKVPGFKSIASAYKEWRAFRDGWLSGRRDVRALSHLESVTMAAEQFFAARAAVVPESSTLGPKDDDSFHMSAPGVVLLAIAGLGAAGLVYLIARK